MATGVTLGQLETLIEAGAQVVEVLPDAEYAQAHLPGAINLPLKQLTAETAGVLDRERAVVVYCWDWL
ncbi:MAG: rhodanese-like domain-containing protein [Actinomycetota bacterium]|nr:rhodanese-like domain-containing protein [Actinomycetota bacterium]